MHTMCFGWVTLNANRTVCLEENSTGYFNNKKPNLKGTWGQLESEHTQSKHEQTQTEREHHHEQQHDAPPITERQSKRPACTIQYMSPELHASHFLTLQNRNMSNPVKIAIKCIVLNIQNIWILKRVVHSFSLVIRIKTPGHRLYGSGRCHA